MNKTQEILSKNIKKCNLFNLLVIISIIIAEIIFIVNKSDFLLMLALAISFTIAVGNRIILKPSKMGIFHYRNEDEYDK